MARRVLAHIQSPRPVRSPRRRSLHDHRRRHLVVGPEGVSRDGTPPPMIPGRDATRSRPGRRIALVFTMRKSTIEILRQRDLRLFFTAWGASSIGSGAGYVALL